MHLPRIVFCAALLCPLGLLAQTFNARITGTITDAAKAAVPAAAVTARNIDTNVRKSVRSDTSGTYDIPLLLPGNWEVTVEAPGLQTQVRKGVLLEASEVVTFDFALPVSAVATAVEVTGDAPLLQTETSSVGTTLESKIIEDYPLPERDVLGALRSIPGVVSNAGNARGNRNVFDSNFSVAGGRSSFNEVLLDGASNTIGDFNGVVILPSPDSVQELRVETSTYSAEFGRSGGGVVNIVTKSGTNKFHGVLYDYEQNTAFNANSFSSNRFGIPRARLHRHQYGGTLGGPVEIPKLYNGRNKTFFFGSYEGRRENNPVGDQLYSVPTARELAGDFSQTVVKVGNVIKPIQIFDPTTTQLINGRYIRTPFPNNVIPPDRLNPIAKAVAANYPAPNRPGNALTSRQNFYFRDQQKYSRDLDSGRVDHYFTDRHRFFGRFNFQENLEKNPGNIVQFASTGSTHDNFKNFGVDDTYQISTALSSVFRYSYTRFRANLVPNTLGFDPTKLGLPSYYRDAANVLFFPNFSFSSGEAFPNLGGTAYNNQPRDTQGLQENLVCVKGRHNLHLGGEYRLYRFYPFQVFNPTGSFSFGHSFTQQDALVASQPDLGFDFASFLLGTGNFSFEHVEALSTYHHYAGAYAQDDWKVTKNLTLNLGIRWEVETGTGEAHNRLSYFDPNAKNPIPNGPKGAILFTGSGNASTLRAANWLNFGPRVGAAYRLGSKTSLRAGYGIFFLPVGLEPGLVDTPFNYSVSADNLNPDYTPKVTLSNPFPNSLTKPSSAAPVNDGSYRLNNSINTVLRDQPSEYMQEWNFGISRELPRSIVIGVTYYGSRGVHLPIPSLQLNQIDSKNLARGGTYLTERVPNPYYGYFFTGLLGQPTIPREQLLKPYPQYAANNSADAFGGSLIYNRPPVGDSDYHAVTLKVEKRFSQGLSLSGFYTISKLLDTGGIGNGAAFQEPSALRDIYNTRLEKSVGDFDVPQRIVINYSYDLPFGKGKKFLDHGRLMNQVAGGWTILSVHTVESGRPIGIGGNDLSRLAGANPSRASVVAGQLAKLPLAQSEANARAYDPACNCTKPWFNTAAFTTTPEFTIPNGPRLDPNLRTDHIRNWDMTLNKRFRIREGVNLAVQSHFFNVLNSVYFGSPIAGVTSATFGSTTATYPQYTGPRRVELGAKLSF